MRELGHITRPAVVLAVTLAVLVIGSPASASIPWKWQRETTVAFSGAGCRSKSTTRAYAGRDAYHVRVNLRIGAFLRDEISGDVVARLTSVRARRTAGRRVYAYLTAVGSGAPCDDPLFGPWRTEDLPVTVSYRRREKVWFNEFWAEGNESLTRRRPRWIHEGTDTGWTGLRWVRWGGYRAIARGYYAYVQKDSVPYRLHRYRVRVVLDHPRLCYQRLRYLRMTTTFRGRPPVLGYGRYRRRLAKHRRINMSCSKGIYR